MGNKSSGSHIELNQESLETYSNLINMGFNEELSMKAVRKYGTNINKCTDFIVSQKEVYYEENDIKSASSRSNDKVPRKMKDPITNKIMVHPIMILSSMKVYDDITIRKWIQSKRNYDPITGIPVEINGWPLLLEPRYDIERKINNFLKKYPSLQSELFTEDDEKSIDWESLFKAQDLKVQQNRDKIVKDQSELTAKAKQIFQPTECKEEYTIEYDDTIILDPTIPVVCFMGPSRNGKSTIVNDILGAKDACAVSYSSNIPQTKGGWIARYSSHKSENKESEIRLYDGNIEHLNDFYLLDMEGLSHDVSQFTKRLFYACYAISNLVIWNDKEIMSDRFRKLMMSLQVEMKAVAKSNKKPSFLYLKRDAGDFLYQPFDTFDEYINKHKSFGWFRDMNIFSSLSAYGLDRPSPDKNAKGLNFHSKPENKALLSKLVPEIQILSKASDRFSANMYILKQQIKHINGSTALNMTKRYVLDNEVLKLFVLPPEGQIERRRIMVYAACEFNWDHNVLEKKFKQEMKTLQETISSGIDNLVIDELTAAKNELYERIKNKQEHKNYGKYGAMAGGAASAVTGTGLFIGTVATAAAIPTAGGSIVLGLVIFGACAAGGAFVGWLGGKGVEKAEETYKDWTNGNYMKYSLGRTDEELKMDEEKKKKVKISFWEVMEEE